MTALAVIGLGPLHANETIIEEWGDVQAPQPPELKPVTVDPGTTALLMLDFMKQNCNEERRPRCVASLPRMKQLLADARAKGVMVVHAIIRNTTTKDISEQVAPDDGEPWVQSGVDKFFGTDLEKILADKGIKTVIAVGTAAHGAVLYTASGAALRGMQVIVPVDGISADNTYVEQYVAHHLVSAPVVSQKVTLTKADMIQF
jgi:nicotinamidase-related amidase